MKITRYIHGAVQNVRGKMTVRTDDVKAMVERRWKHCQGCLHRGVVQVLGKKYDGCTICTCPFKEKLVLKDEICARNPPLWGKEQ